MPTDNQTARWNRYWDKKSCSYDKEIGFFDRHLFGDSRHWVCSRATGEVLEVAVGTGLNLPAYPSEVRLTGIDWSEPMLALARDRATVLGRPAVLRHADAQELPFDDASFDTVVCTFGLCAIPDHTRALAEMIRVLRPGGLLLLADHVASSSGAARVAQQMLQLFTVPLGGEHFLRRPSRHLELAGLHIEHIERFTLGLVERIAARKPETGAPSDTTDRSTHD